MVNNLKVCVDSNEASMRKDILNALQLAGCEIRVQSLSVCDYIVSDRCGIERKDARDFISSIMDGRLFNQAEELAVSYEKPIIVLEGKISSILKISKMNPNSVYGALASLSLDYGLSVIPTENPEGTAVLIQRLAYREQTEEKRPLQIRSISREMPPHRKQLFLLSGLPNIGSTLGEELLRHFDTPHRVIEEFVKAEVTISKSGKTKRLNGPLKEVRGIGPNIVENAQRILTNSFKRLCNLNSNT